MLLESFDLNMYFLLTLHLNDRVSAMESSVKSSLLNKVTLATRHSLSNNTQVLACSHSVALTKLWLQLVL